MPSVTGPSLVLGTAQWGLDYGLTNKSGRLTDQAIGEIVAGLSQAGITLLDTAAVYGDAEARIGQLAAGIAVQTKVVGSAIRESLAESMKRLGCAPQRLLLHDWPALPVDERVAAAHELEAIRADGLVGAVGISGYDAADLDSAMQIFTQLDIVQMPVSLLDQRLVDSDAVRSFGAGGGVVQARSVYLQGVALSHSGQSALADHPHVERLRLWCADAQIDVGAACRAYVRQADWIDEIVIGVTSAEELRAWSTDVPLPNLPWRELASDDEELLDPRRWPSTRPE